MSADSPQVPRKLLAEWFWVDRWDGSSAVLLPLEARGLYREMLSQAWRRGAKLPSDPAIIQRAIRCTVEEWNRCWPLVQGYWRVDGANLVNDTQIQVYIEAKEMALRAKERSAVAAQASAQARAQAQAQARAQALAQDEPSVSVSVSVSETDSNHQDPPKILGNSKRETPVKSGNGNGNQHAARASLSPAAPQSKERQDPFTDPVITERAGRFIERYEVLYRQQRKGARYTVKPHRDYAASVTLCKTWDDDAHLDDLAVVFLTSDHKFAEEGSRTIPQFLALASWCDGKLAEHRDRKGKRA